jgi:hypothetical protein
MSVDFNDARIKFNLGDRISDEELDCLYNYYKNVYDSVSDKHEPTYTLVWQDASRKEEALRCMKDARKHK